MSMAAKASSKHKAFSKAHGFLESGGMPYRRGIKVDSRRFLRLIGA
jgi:hypothetical protein